MALVYTIIFMGALCGFVSLAVDYGRAEMDKTELRSACDAASRYGVVGLQTNSSTAISNAIAVAAQNTVDTTPLVLLSSDVVVGTWASNTFTAGGSSPNAVQVTGYRTAARGTAIPLIWGQVFGVNTVNITATSISKYTAASSGYGMFGLSSISFSNGTSIDSYNASTGSYSSSTATSHGNIGTNGVGTIVGGSTIKGTFSYGPSGTYTMNNGGSVTGTISQLSSAASYTTPSAGTYSTTNNNSSIPAAYLSGTSFSISNGNSFSMPAGTYYFTSMSLGGGATLSMQGAVTIYLNGQFNYSNGATINTYNNLPSNLLIDATSTGTISIAGGTNLYAHIDAPQAPFAISNGGAFYGSVVAQSINITGGGGIHYDESAGTGSGSAGTVSIVY
jgi:Flp pilus assembly protein TadG